MTTDDLRSAVARGACSWDDIASALDDIGVSRDRQRALFAGGEPIPAFVALRLWQLIDSADASAAAHHHR